MTEVELFKAVDRWATKECERQGITSDGETKRRVLGEEIVRGIRFPLMEEKDFASVVLDSHLLNHEELCNMIKHYNNVLNIPLPFVQACRDIFSKQRCQRFNEFHKGWNNSGNSPDCIVLSVNKPIELHGVEQFGSEGGKYTVKTDIVDHMGNTLLVSRAGNYASEKSDTRAYYGFEVLFDRPVILEANKEYEVKSFIKGPPSWWGGNGQTWSAVECNLRFVVVGEALMGPMKTADRFLEFCFQYPSRNSNVTRTVPINVEPCESLLGQVVMD